jgi:hypothetical protein
MIMRKLFQTAGMEEYISFLERLRTPIYQIMSIRIVSSGMFL